MERLAEALAVAVHGGLLSAAALVDRRGQTIATAGAIDKDEARALTALVLRATKNECVVEELFAGQIVPLALEGRMVAVGIARRQLFLVAVLAYRTDAFCETVGRLRDRIAELLAHPGGDDRMPPAGGSGGSGSGPAELQLVELGITKARGKA